MYLCAIFFCITQKDLSFFKMSLLDGENVVLRGRFFFSFSFLNLVPCVVFLIKVLFMLSGLTQRSVFKFIQFLVSLFFLFSSILNYNLDSNIS